MATIDAVNVYNAEEHSKHQGPSIIDARKLAEEVRYGDNWLANAGPAPFESCTPNTFPALPPRKEATSRESIIAKEGHKDDGNKARLDLVPWDAVLAVCEIYRRGADKYAPRNWEKGMAYSRMFSALERHLIAWWHGERTDDEGVDHLQAVAFYALGLLAYTGRGIGTDDRPSMPKPTDAQAERYPYTVTPAIDGRTNTFAQDLFDFALRNTPPEGLSIAVGKGAFD